MPDHHPVHKIYEEPSPMLEQLFHDAGADPQTRNLARYLKIAFVLVVIQLLILIALVIILRTA